ncbi:trehalose 6-phosphatase [Herbihabitans rhizosphaerae]|uniref:Trehalose 6-phosphatase n=1 Tax=Herbihabitans rhizosphaerae TaxID=1872711 RepID=A0A4Q7L699_9PSEU|nr:trehalose-phosphatase [Herbihabitans rhizosphaerae]RZS44824.1 trehalose 6-phosphatase [Herbihabitans rhizosphaerae]
MAAEALPAELRRAIVQIARTPRLLVACDYDGTLAPIVQDPETARPLPESVSSLRSLAGLHETTTAVISGRALRDLATLSRLPGEVHLVGSHGSEFDIGFVHALDGRARELHKRVEIELEQLVTDADGVHLEVKPASVAVHVRRAEAAVGQRVLDQVSTGPATWDGVQVTEGKAVIELAVVQTDKGHALDVLRHQVGATAAIFVGDDVTDEKAFARLAGPDLGIKVGDGDSLAEFRITDSTAVAMTLAFLLEERRHWLYGEQAPPIERLSMLANERSVALLTPDAKLTWMCHPEPDSAAVFADLLGGPGAGHFSIRPERGGLPLGQRYLPGTMTVETRWSGLLVTDYLEHYPDPHRTEVVRVISGNTPAVVEFAPRPEFGQVQVRLHASPDGLRVFGTSDPVVLRAPGLEWEITSDGMHDTARTVIRPTGDQPVVLELRCGTTDLGASPVAQEDRKARANAYWTEWLDTLTLPSAERELVARSALTLRGLCHSETGAIMAAATTSLPEEIGGIRNWDYRYCWLRDAAMTAKALVSLGSTGEAEAYLGWLHRVLGTLPGPERLHPLYTIAGTTLPPEAVIDTLPGYAGSRPVRVGNLANQQVQLDVFGPVVDLVAALSLARGKLIDDDWRMVNAMAEAVTRRWHEPDHGIWEERHRPRHHVYSKVMCWLTIDRAITLAETYGREPVPGWAELRDRIAQDVLNKGWNSEVRAFTTAYDGTDLDSATLHVGLVGLIDPSDERFQSTVTAIEAELRSGSTVYRYHRDDGLPGNEGGFHLCAAWMIEAYLLTGRRTEAEDLFEQLVDAAGPTGLLPEEYDPIAERSLGNHPQAYSHLGLIRCAQLLST